MATLVVLLFVVLYSVSSPLYKGVKKQPGTVPIVTALWMLLVVFAIIVTFIQFYKLL